jgi:IS5 family transposase
MLLDTEEEIFESAIPEEHPYRQLFKHINFKKLVKPLRKHYSDQGQTGYGIEAGLKTMLVQFWEDLSDREMERALRENLVFKWFCGFGLKDQTPDHSYFGRLRSRLGTERVAKLFNQVNNQLNAKDLYGEVFTFMDATKVISKVHLWKERDQAIADGYEKLNNQVVDKYASDKDARWGAKSKRDIWFGYKRHCGVDMRHGLIAKTTITPANIPDNQVVADICPTQGAVFADKLYDTKSTDELISGKGCYPATIRKRTNKTKDKDLDNWRSVVRMPFESTFSRLPRRARYRGLDKVNFQNYMECLVYNLKKAVRILSVPPPRQREECANFCYNKLSLGSNLSFTS